MLVLGYNFLITMVSVTFLSSIPFLNLLWVIFWGNRCNLINFLYCTMVTLVNIELSISNVIPVTKSIKFISLRG